MHNLFIIYVVVFFISEMPSATLELLRSLGMKSYMQDIEQMCYVTKRTDLFNSIDKQLLVTDQKYINNTLEFCKLYDLDARRKKLVFYNHWKLSPEPSGNISEDITLVTQMTLNKADVFDRLIEHWTGPVSVALYHDCNDSMLDLKHYVSKWSQRHNIDVHIVIKTTVSLLFYH